MKYYQAVYQMDEYGYNVVYSRNIWKTEQEAYLFLEEMRILLKAAIHANWVITLHVDQY